MKKLTERRACVRSAFIAARHGPGTGIVKASSLRSDPSKLLNHDLLVNLKKKKNGIKV